MLDPELKTELQKINVRLFNIDDQFERIHREFQKVDIRLVTIDQRLEKVDRHLNAHDARLDTLQDTVESLARSTAEGFEEIDEHFDKFEVKIQNQVDAIAERKADRSELSPIQAQLRNLQKH